MNSASAKIRFGDGAITYDDLRVARDEGIGTGAFTYDFKNHEVRVANVKATLRPPEVIFWIDPKLWKAVAPYKFRQPPNINANGVYQFRGGKKTRLEVTVDTATGMEYGFLGKTLPFDRVSVNFPGGGPFAVDNIRIATVNIPEPSTMLLVLSSVIGGWLCYRHGQDPMSSPSKTSP